MNNKKNIIVVFNFMFAVFFLIICYILFRYRFIHFNSTIKIGSTIIITLSIVISAICFSFYEKIEKYINLKVLYITFSAIYLIIQIFIAAKMNYVPVTDAQYIDLISRNYINSGVENLYEGLNDIHNHYLARYENQWGIFLILSAYYKLLDTVLGYIPQQASVVLNILALQAALLFSFLIGCEIFHKKKQKFVFIIFILCHPVLYTYTCYFYTDSLSMPFVAISIYALIKLIKSQRNKSFNLWLCICALSTAIGYSIKGSIAIILVATLIIAFINYNIKDFARISGVMLSFLIIVSTANSLIIKSNGIVSAEESDKYKFPAVHWIMMGLNGRGGYNHDDYLYTYGFETLEEKSDADKEMIKQRLSDMGVKGFISHVQEKLKYTWSHPMFLTTHILSESPESNVKTFFTETKGFYNYCFIVHIVFMCFTLVAGIYSAIIRRKDYISYICLIMLGVILFLILWETRSRYWVNFIPIMMLLAVEGFCVSGKILNQLLYKIKNKITKAYES